jgi:hypothetical protein
MKSKVLTPVKISQLSRDAYSNAHDPRAQLLETTPAGPIWKIIRLRAFKIDTSCCRQSATIAVFIDFLLWLKFILR